MNWNSFCAQNYYLTHYFPTSSYVAEITHPFTGADRGSLRIPTDIFEGANWGTQFSVNY